MVINKNRILVGLILIFSILFFYFFKLDFLFIFLITLGIFYEIFKSGLLTLKGLFILLFSYLLLFLIYINIDISIYLFIFIFLSFLVTLFSNNYVNIFFSFFLIVLSIIIFNLITQNREIVYFIIMLSFINDTTAYIFGNLLKGPLIVSKISPNKTWSGTTISILISFVILLFLNFSYLIAFTLSISLFLGDIYFSYIKRNLSIKDFSNTLSSHGGILDRLDSMSFLFIAFALFNYI